MKVSILIPVFNEEDTIIKMLDKISLERKNLSDINFEVIVIDDGSKDNSKKLLENNSNLFTHLISYEKNRGKDFQADPEKEFGAVCGADMKMIEE